MRKNWMISTTVVVAIILGVVALAEADPFDEPRQRPRARERARLRERIELMKIWKLTDALDLDQETAAKLFPMLHEQEAEQQKLREKRHEILGEMRAEVAKDEPDSAALRRMIDKFKQNELDVLEMRNKRLDDLSELLSDTQIAKMIIFVPRFERDMWGMICDVRARHKQRRGEEPMRRGPKGVPPEPGDFPAFE